MQKKLNINIEECKNKGITLIAFVITIIILLILAGLSISALTGSGLFGKANNVAKEYEKATIKEELQLAILDIQSMKRGNITREDLWESCLKHFRRGSRRPVNRRCPSVPSTLPAASKN